MSNIDLAKKALSHITDTWFTTNVGSYEDWRFGDSFETDCELKVKAPQIRYLLNLPELIDPKDTEEIDVEKILLQYAYDCSWPDGEPCYQFHEGLPERLQEIADAIGTWKRSHSPKKKEEHSQRIHDLIEGLCTPQEYTFMADYGSRFNFLNEDIEINIPLSREEALGFIEKEVGEVEILKEYNPVKITEKALQTLAQTYGDAEDPYTYHGECAPLDKYIESWRQLIKLILDGKIAEDELDSWLAYFDKGIYKAGEDAQSIQQWHEEPK